MQEGEQVAVRLRVYPNPARDLVMAVGFKGKATIVDILGRVIATINAREPVDVATLPRGLYIVRAGGQVATFVLIE